jgi:hypothetical protein
MAPKRTQLEWTELAVKGLETKAKEAGLLGADERLVYTAPDKKNGVTASIVAYDSHGVVARPLYWIAEPLPGDTNRTVERIVNAQERMLYATLLQSSFVKAIDAQD